MPTTFTTESLPGNLYVRLSIGTAQTGNTNALHMRPSFPTPPLLEVDNVMKKLHLIKSEGTFPQKASEICSGTRLTSLSGPSVLEGSDRQFLINVYTRMSEHDYGRLLQLSSVIKSMISLSQCGMRRDSSSPVCKSNSPAAKTEALKTNENLTVNLFFPC